MKAILSSILIWALLFTNAFGAGKIQGADVKSLAELVSAGGGKPQLITDDKIYIASNGINDQLSNAITNGLIGGGSGTSINYISKYNGETGITGWNTYADTAGTQPVDGTGGSPTVTYATTTSSPLRGTTSFLFTKGASNLQGQGFSYDFTIDAADKGKILQASMDYAVASGTYADNDMSFWIYDVTNGVMIQPAPYLLKNTTINDKMFFEFQSTTSTSYRLIGHVGSTSTSAYTLKFDNFVVGPNAKLYGSPIIDLGSYSPAISNGWGSVTGSSFQYGQIGSYMWIKGSFTAGSVAANIASISLPAGYSVDTSRVINNTTSNPGSRVGDMSVSPTNGYGLQWAVTAPATDATKIYFGYAAAITGGAQPFTTPQNGNAWAVGLVQVDLLVPIAGWSSSQVRSSDADTRIVEFIGSVNGSVSNTSTNGAFTTIRDTHGCWTGTTCIVPVAGDYNISINFSTTSSGGDTIAVYVNGTLAASLAQTVTGGQILSGHTTLPNLKAGDVISIRGTTGGSMNISASQRLSITRVSGPAQVMMSESVNCRVNSSTTNIGTTDTTVVFTSKSYDSHNAYNTSTGQYTAPLPGKYSVKIGIISPAVAQTLGGGTGFTLYKNGVAQNNISRLFSQSASTYRMGYYGADTIQLLAGDVIDIRGKFTTAGALDQGTDEYMVIERVGN